MLRKQGRKGVIHSNVHIFWSFIVFLGVVCVYVGWDKQQHTTVTIEWKTASEVSTAGFNIYRADGSEGPYSKINQDMIPASNDPLTGGNYQYIDRNVQARHHYFYQLEDVETNGKVNRHGPVQVSNVGGGFYVTLFYISGGLLLVLGDIALILEFVRKRKKDTILNE
jgi:hypothetical protein